MDPDPGGPKTYGSDGSGSATLPKSLFRITTLCDIVTPLVGVGNMKAFRPKFVP